LGFLSGLLRRFDPVPANAYGGGKAQRLAAPEQGIEYIALLIGTGHPRLTLKGGRACRVVPWLGA